MEWKRKKTRNNIKCTFLTHTRSVLCCEFFCAHRCCCSFLCVYLLMWIYVLKPPPNTWFFRAFVCMYYSFAVYISLNDFAGKIVQMNSLMTNPSRAHTNIKSLDIVVLFSFSFCRWRWHRHREIVFVTVAVIAIGLCVRVCVWLLLCALLLWKHIIQYVIDTF